MEMETYLTNKYKKEFVIENANYNYLSETYQSFAYPKGHPGVLFTVRQDPDTKTRYSDTYPKVFWGSDLADNVKAKIKRLYPGLDEDTFQVLQILEREEIYSPNTPTYEQLKASPLSCSITINLKSNWQKANQRFEIQKARQLNHYLHSIHLPVLTEVRYKPWETDTNEKVIFITEDGRIIAK